MDPTTVTIAISVCAALAMAGIAYVFLGRSLETQERTSRRVSAVAGGSSSTKRKTGQIDAAAQRRKQVATTIKELEEKQKKSQKISLRAKLLGAGLKMSPRGFYIGSAILAAIVGVLALIVTQSLFVALPAALAGGLGLPRWILGFLIRRRQAAFISEFANSLDVIVRGVKSGLPINECLKVIAVESPDPVGPEFSEIVDSQRLGVPLEQCLERLYERIPVPEVNFFMIVLSIQQKTGGNLAETLNNLATVLRDRKKMKAKIQAVSAEAKASAMIIGSLPFAIMGIMSITSPDYLSVLFTEPMGHLLLLGGGLWMFLGVLVMRKMIAFDF